MRALAILLLLSAAGFVCEASAGDEITITLHHSGAALEHLVVLGDVADVDTPNAELQQKLEEIDLWEFKDGESQDASLARNLIQTRLLLAGYSQNDLRWRGAEECVVRRGRNIQASASRESRPRPRLSQHVRLTDMNLESALQERIADAVDLEVEDVKVHLTNPCFSRTLAKEHLGQMGKLELTIPNRPQPGRVTVGVRVLTDLKLLATIQTQVDLSLRRPILTAKSDLPRGTRISETDLVERPQWLTRAEAHPRQSDAVGAVLSRDVLEGQGLKVADLVHRPAAAAGDPSIVIKARDKVSVTARKGPLAISMQNAQSTEQGRVGEWISVRNIESGKIVFARVVGPGEVEILLK